MGKATITAVTYEGTALRLAREYAADAARTIHAQAARIAELEAQNDMLRHATDKLRAMLAELNARHEPLQRAFITAVELLNDAALEGEKDEQGFTVTLPVLRRHQIDCLRDNLPLE